MEVPFILRWHGHLPRQRPELARDGRQVDRLPLRRQTPAPKHVSRYFSTTNLVPGPGLPENHQVRQQPPVPPGLHRLLLLEEYQARDIITV